jgi:hypothetical protein
MYEHHTHRLLEWPAFLVRAGRHLFWGAVVIVCVLAAGMVGYHALGGLTWIDAFLNASMILGGMGPVDRMDTTAAKLFAGLYALFSGLVFIGVVSVVLAPWVHRLFHAAHLEEPPS